MRTRILIHRYVHIYSYAYINVGVVINPNNLYANFKIKSLLCSTVLWIEIFPPRKRSINTNTHEVNETHKSQESPGI